jgi:hypothetical protein
MKAKKKERKRNELLVFKSDDKREMSAEAGIIQRQIQYAFHVFTLM